MLIAPLIGLDIGGGPLGAGPDIAPDTEGRGAGAPSDGVTAYVFEVEGVTLERARAVACRVCSASA
jgi:hypothetical protein